MQVENTEAPACPASARPTSDAVLDVRVVQRLRSIPGRATTLFEELVPIFVASTPRRIERLRALALPNGTAAAAVEEARDLAAMCACLGAMRMERAAADLHQCLVRSCADHRDRLALLGRLEAEFRLVENTLVTLRTG